MMVVVTRPVVMLMLRQGMMNLVRCKIRGCIHTWSSDIASVVLGVQVFIMVLVVMIVMQYLLGRRQSYCCV